MSNESTAQSFSNKESLEARKEIFKLMNDFSWDDSEKERSLGLFLRGSLLARIIATQELYLKIVDLPGTIFDVGTWRGQTAVLCENFRAIYEPLNFRRKIVGFDTFDGYPDFSKKDKPLRFQKKGTYQAGGIDYVEYLKKLICLHEKSNAMGHNHNKHEIIVGNTKETIPLYFKDNPHSLISLAFLDLNSYESTYDALTHIYPKIVPSGIIAFWQLQNHEVHGEGGVYNDLINSKYSHECLKSRVYPGLCYIIKKTNSSNAILN